MIGGGGESLVHSKLYVRDELTTLSIPINASSLSLHPQADKSLRENNRKVHRVRMDIRHTLLAKLPGVVEPGSNPETKASDRSEQVADISASNSGRDIVIVAKVIVPLIPHSALYPYTGLLLTVMHPYLIQPYTDRLLSVMHRYLIQPSSGLLLTVTHPYLKQPYTDLLLSVMHPYLIQPSTDLILTVMHPYLIQPSTD